MGIETLQHPWELSQFVELFERMKPQRILEIGCWHGGTLAHWLRPDVHVVAIDDEMRGATEWRKWAKDAGADIDLLKGFSTDPSIVEQAGNLGPFDWIFLDADHTYPAVKADWEIYREMVAPGGVFAFHDLRPYEHGQVDQLWAEIRGVVGQRTMEFHETLAAWGGIGVVFFP